MARCKPGTARLVKSGKGGKRCACTTATGGRKLIAMDACRIKAKARKKRKKVRSGAVCLPDSSKILYTAQGYRCTCKTREGKRKIIAKSRCSHF